MNVSLKLNKKGFTLGQMPSAVVLLVIVAIVLGLGATVLGDMQDSVGNDNCAARSDTYTSYNTTSNQCYNSSGTHVAVGTYEFNTTVSGLEGVDTVSGWQDTIALLVAVGVILGIVAYALMRRFKG